MQIIKELLIDRNPHESKEAYARRVMEHYRISRATAFRWIARGYAEIRVYPETMPALDIATLRQVALRSARYVAARYKDYHLIDECEQMALIALWKDADRINAARAGVPYTVRQGRNKGQVRVSKGPMDLAYRIARHAALKALKWWHRHRDLPLDSYLAQYDENDDESLGLDGPLDSSDK